MIIDGGKDEEVSELLELTRENNRLLRGLYRSMLWSRTLTTIYWFLIIGSMVGAYYYLQPILVKYMNSYDTIMRAVSTIEGGSGKLNAGFQKMMAAPQ